MLFLIKKIFLYVLITSCLFSTNDIKLQVHKFKNIKYLDYNEFVNQNELRNTYYSAKQKYEFVYKNKYFYFSESSPFCKVNDNIYNMAYPAVQKEKKLYLPVYAFYKIFKKEGLPFKLLKLSEDQLVSTSYKFNVNSLAFDNKSNGTVISLKTSIPFDKQNIATSLQDNRWLNITVLDGIIDSAKVAQTKLLYPIEKIEIIQMDGSMQLSFLLQSNNENVTVETTDSAINILLQTSIEENKNKINDSRKKWLIDTIVLDAGHGGKDPGALGNNLQEKDIVLDITKRLGALLERNLDVNVVYTRTTDIFVPLKKRTKIANESGGKLFLSIHVNAHKHEYINGFETYLLQSDAIGEAVEVAIRENTIIESEKKPDNKDLSKEDNILANLLQTSYMKESEELAILIQKHMSSNLLARDRGVKQAGFHVLEGASMPNVLIEVGFLSNKKEAKNLSKAKYRKTIAESIFYAIKEYKEIYDAQVLDE